jgi:hypothetical protein
LCGGPNLDCFDHLATTEATDYQAHNQKIRMEPELSSPPESGEILAFFVRRDTVCGECGEELARGSMITLDRNKGALCLECADLDHLEFLARGDTALDRKLREWTKPASHTNL